jgi:DNA helicase-2/ATP-dependent DNA helicase PcrA
VAKPGTIVVTTMHKAKGLEWDAVYLMCVDSLEFPDTLEDTFRDELYFLPGRSPAVETNRFLEQLMNGDLATSDEGTQLEQVRLEYIAERLRLLYVGITRAKRDLAFTWSESNGRRHVRPATAALALRDTVDWQKGGGAR